MDLYRAIKIDNCHSSPGVWKLTLTNWAQPHMAAAAHTNPSMPHCHLDALSNLAGLPAGD